MDIIIYLFIYNEGNEKGNFGTFLNEIKMRAHLSTCKNQYLPNIQIQLGSWLRDIGSDSVLY